MILFDSVIGTARVVKGIIVLQVKCFLLQLRLESYRVWYADNIYCLLQHQVTLDDKLDRFYWFSYFTRTVDLCHNNTGFIKKNYMLFSK